MLRGLMRKMSWDLLKSLRSESRLRQVVTHLCCKEDCTLSAPRWRDDDKDMAMQAKQSTMLGRRGEKGKRKKKKKKKKGTVDIIKQEN